MEDRQAPNDVQVPDPVAVTPASRDHLSAIYQQYQADICHYINRIFGKGPPEPEDVAQQVFINFLEQVGAKGVQNPRAYLYRIAHNLVVNLHRKTSVRRRYLTDQKNTADSQDSDDIHPERILMARERLILMERVIWEMPAKRRKMFILSRVKGLSYIDIARQTGMSKSVVRQHVLNGLEDLQKAVRRMEMVNKGAEQSR